MLLGGLTPHSAGRAKPCVDGLQVALPEAAVLRQRHVSRQHRDLLEQRVLCQVAPPAAGIGAVLTWPCHFDILGGMYCRATAYAAVMADRYLIMLIPHRIKQKTGTGMHFSDRYALHSQVQQSMEAAVLT